LLHLRYMLHFGIIFECKIPTDEGATAETKTKAATESPLPGSSSVWPQLAHATKNQRMKNHAKFNISPPLPCP